MLLNNNILKSKNIAINIIKKFALIDSINITIALKTRLIKIAIQHSIYLKKIVVVLFYSKITVSINYFSLLNIKNFLFEFNNDLNIFIYIYIINIFINVVIVCNNKSVSIKIFKNFRFERMFEIDFFNAFFIDDIFEKIFELIFKRSKIIYQNN